MAKAYEALDRGQKYFAKIRKDSPYVGQISWAKARPQIGYPFPVRLTDRGPLDEYCVKGGPGGQYRIEDLDIYMEKGGKLVRVKVQ